MGLALCEVGVAKPGVWEQAQKLTLCRRLLQQCCDDYAKHYGVRLDIDDRQFTAAFFAWLDVILSNTAYRGWNERDYFQFSYGVLLRELLHKRAVHVDPVPQPYAPASPDDIPRWWPVGYSLTQFCVEMLARTLREECSTTSDLLDPGAQPALWKSFRENLIEEPSLAIAYFDKLMGIEPNWREPSMIVNRPTAGSFGKSAS